MTPSAKRLAFGAMVALVGRFPAAGYLVADAVSSIAWRLKSRTRRRVTHNLLPACGGDRGAAKGASLEVFRNVGRYYIDVASLPRRDPATLEGRYLTIEGAEQLEVLAANIPVVVVSAHAGNPEFAIQALAHRGRTFAALVEPLEPRDYADALLRVRSSAGGHYYEATVGGVRAAIRELRAGSLLGLMADRDIQGNGICVDLFGKRARLPRGPWEIARREGAMVLPILCRRSRGPAATLFVHQPYVVENTGDEQGDICRAATRWAKLLEEHIRNDPGQWTVLEDFWALHGCEAD